MNEASLSTPLSFCVFCGSRPGVDPIYEEQARALGHTLARHGIDLIFGGGNRGLMGVVSQTALAEGARVTGVIPTFLIERERPLENLTKLEYCEDFPQRKKRMAELASAFVVLPGGIGTLDEAFDILTKLSVGRLNKPIGFVNPKGYWQALFNMIDTGRKAGFVDDEALQKVVIASSAEEVVEKLLALLSDET